MTIRPKTPHELAHASFNPIIWIFSIKSLILGVSLCFRWIPFYPELFSKNFFSVLGDYNQQILGVVLILSFFFSAFAVLKQNYTAKLVFVVSGILFSSIMASEMIIKGDFSSPFFVFLIDAVTLIYCYLQINKKIAYKAIVDKYSERRFDKQFTGSSVSL